MSTETLLVELGTEELPPKALKYLGQAFRDGVLQGLQQRELAYDKDSEQWFASPRRLAVLVKGVQLQAPDKAVEALGPPADRAKDEDGNWAPAAAGFAKKQGVDPEELQVIETPKGQRLGISRIEPGTVLKDCLNEIIQASIQALPIPKRMRWGARREEFVRPVHWVVAMVGTDSDHGEILGLPSGSTTCGHRFHSSGKITLERPEDYEKKLENAHVIAGFDKRRERIQAQVTEEAAKLGAVAVIDEDLLDEVTGLVEWPKALTGSFDERFLEVPEEALVSSMKEHQKYFHLRDKKGDLLPKFITVCNIESEDPAQVIAGNERVIRPRLADAAFFFETDKKTALAGRVAGLDSIVFQQKLGTLLDKTQRVSRLARQLAPLIGADPALAGRAALLSKADLASDMVLEFADMQGIAGSYYALNDEEDPEVAAALAQQYWPKFAGDRLPENPTACSLALADRLDTLVGIFGIGQPPTGSKDPFALRRASLAVLRILVEKDLDVDLRECLNLAAAEYENGVLGQETTSQVLDYMLERFRAWYEEENIPTEVFRAVSALGPTRPTDIQRRVHAVNAFTQLPEAAALAAANKRVSNILAKVEAGYKYGDVSANLLQEPQEKALQEKLAALTSVAAAHIEQDQYTEALASLAALREPVDAFFDGVMVNAQNEDLRRNRLSLLRDLRGIFLQVADISQLVVGK